MKSISDSSTNGRHKPRFTYRPRRIYQTQPNDVTIIYPDVVLPDHFTKKEFHDHLYDFPRGTQVTLPNKFTFILK
jgi:hypothetical protein